MFQGFYWLPVEARKEFRPPPPPLWWLTWFLCHWFSVFVFFSTSFSRTRDWHNLRWGSWVELVATLKCLLSTKTRCPNLGSGRFLSWVSKNHWSFFTFCCRVSCFDFSGVWSLAVFRSASATIQMWFRRWFHMQTWEIVILSCVVLQPVHSLLKCSGIFGSKV